MASPATRIKKATGILLLVCVAAPGTLADWKVSKASRRPLNLCYCPCKAARHQRECIRMCDLLEGQERSWPSACRAQSQPILRKKNPESNPRPPKQNGREMARR
jgi:hypothetical protein